MKAKKTTKQKAKKVEDPTTYTVTKNIFNGPQVHFDGDALETISMIADGLTANAMALQANARGLASLAETFKGQQVKTTLLHVGPPSVGKEDAE